MRHRHRDEELPDRSERAGATRSASTTATASNAAVQRAAATGSARALASFGLLGAVGNAAVRRAVNSEADVADRDPDPAAGPQAAHVVQRDGPQLRLPPLGGSFGASPPGSSGNFQLRLDPEIEAQLRALEAMRELLAPQRVSTGLAQLQLPGPLPVGPPAPAPGSPAPGAVPLSTPAAPGPTAPPPLPAEARPGTFADVWRAVQADPALGPAIEGLQEQAAALARQEWNALTTGGRVAVVSSAVVIGGAAATGVLSSPEGRDFIASRLRGAVLPVPAVPGLGIQLDLGGDNVIVGVHLDVGQLLPAALGFGAGQATPLGQPSNPYQGMSTQRATAGPSTTDLEEDFAGRLAASSRGGAPLAPDVRDTLEQRLETGLSGVRVHTDQTAADLARAVNAVAFTSGQHIFFSPGAYQPDTPDGQRLLVHEAVHTVQQAAGPVDGTAAGGVSVSDPSDRFEREASRIAATPGPAPAAAAAPGVLRALGAHGAAAVQRQPAAPTSLIGQTSSAIGVPVSQESLHASATIAAGQTISNADGKWIHTVDPTTLHIWVTGSRLTISLSPQLVITADSGHWFVPNPDIYLREAWFDFSTGGYGVSITAPNYALWAGADTQTLAGVGSLFAKMPARMRSGGYDPFTDANLVADLQTMANGFSGGGGGPALRMNNAEFGAEVTLGAELKQNLGGASIALPAGTRMSLSVRPDGDVPTSAAEFANLKVASVELALSQQASVNLNVAGGDLPVVWVSSAVLRRGGHLHLNYVLINEAIGGALRELVRAGVAPGTPEFALSDPSSPTAHALVDRAIAQHLDPLIRAAILANRSVIPGLDLGRALGVE